MEHSNLLMGYEYSIMGSSAPGTESRHWEKHQVPGGMPLVSLKINFEKGLFFLEGNWPYMVATEKGASRTGRRRKRVRVRTEISPWVVVDLADRKSDAYYFTLAGAMQDDTSQNSCSGQLVIEKTADITPEFPGQWRLTFLLYDTADDGWSIEFRLPIYPETKKDALN